jgi:hypothetical protein
MITLSDVLVIVLFVGLLRFPETLGVGGKWKWEVVAVGSTVGNGRRAPPRDKSVKFLPGVSVPPAIVSKDDREWNYVVADTVQREHIDGGALLGRVVLFHSGSNIRHLFLEV